MSLQENINKGKSRGIRPNHRPTNKDASSRERNRVAEASKSTQPQATEQKFSVSSFKNITDTTAVEMRGTWAELCRLLNNPDIRETKDGDLFSPALFSDNRRHKETVTELSMLVFDFDGALSLDLARKVLDAQPFPYAIYTTHSHQRVTDAHPKAEDRFRVVMPFCEPIPIEEYPYVWEGGNILFYRRADTQSRDASRAYYLPAKFSEDSPFEFFCKVKGNFPSWKQLAEWGRNFQESAKAEKQVAKEQAAELKYNGKSPFDDYAERGDWRALLTEIGAEPARDCADGEQWKHPDSKHPGSIVVLTTPDDKPLIHVRTHRFAMLEKGMTYTPARLYATVRHGGDLTTAAKALYKEGYGERAKPDNKSTDNTAAILDGKLRLSAEPAERGKVKLTARNADGAVIHKDLINLDSARDRETFIKALSLTDDESKTVQSALLRIADSPIAPLNVEAENATEERVMSKILSDGRVIEQIAGLKFAVYDPTTDTFTYAESIEDNGITYKPSENTGDMFLPDALTEYGTEAELERRIEEIYRRYCDAPDRAIKVASKYVRMTYITDLLNEVPYLKAVGEPGSGKSRFCGVGSMMSYHPVSIVSITQAVLFRLVDECSPTLFIDEFNPKAGGEDIEGIMQVLLAGFQRVAKVYRTGEPDADGKRKVEQYSAFGAKFLAGLKSSGSDALESRCFEVRLEKTTRTDITFRTSERMKRDCAEIASMLLLWRLRNLKKDYETLLDAAETDLKRYAVDPRDIQIATPLYALIDDDNLKKEFADSLEKRTRTTRSEKLEGFEGKIVKAVYDSIYDASGETVNQRRPFDVGEPIYEASTTDIKESLSDEYPDLKDGYIGKKLTELGFTKARLSKRSYNGKPNEKRERNAVVFDPDKLTKVFVGYGLPLPGEAPAQMELVEIEDQIPFMLDKHPEPEKAGKRR